MGKRSTKQLAYLSEHLGKFKPSADITSPFSQLDADALLSLIPLSLIMNSPRVRVEASRQREHMNKVEVGVRYGKESLAFGYLIGIAYNHLKDAREKVVGLRGLNDLQFDMLINCWVLAQLSHVFKASQLMKHTGNRKHFYKVFKELVSLGFLRHLSASEVHDITGLIVPSHMLNAKYYCLTRETDKIFDEFNLMFTRVYRDFTRNSWVNDLEAL
jgi:hypothetical protein